MGDGNRPSAGHYVGDGRVICGQGSNGSWGVSAVYYESDPQTGDILGFDIATHPTESGVSVTLTLAKQNVDGPGWFVSWNQAPGYNPRFSFTVNDEAQPVVITAVADDISQHIEITATCSIVMVP